jgi:leucyl aminopeptidase
MWTGAIPLCENMLGGLSMKPGDVVRCLKGKTIKIQSSDHDGRLILADVLTYSQNYKPCLVINIATLTSKSGSFNGERPS